MADNVAITAGAGTNVATDDISGVHYQRVKLSIGADGAAADIAGDTTNGIDVDVTRFPNESVTAKTADCSSSGNNTVHTPGGGLAVRLYYISLSADYDNTASVTAYLRFGAAGSAQYKVELPPGATWARNIGAGRRYITGAADEAVIVNLSAAQTVYASIEYVEV